MIKSSLDFVEEYDFGTSCLGQKPLKLPTCYLSTINIVRLGDGIITFSVSDNETSETANK